MRGGRQGSRPAWGEGSWGATQVEGAAAPASAFLDMLSHFLNSSPVSMEGRMAGSCTAVLPGHPHTLSSCSLPHVLFPCPALQAGRILDAARPQQRQEDHGGRWWQGAFARARGAALLCACFPC
eukprot:1155502-Pelagomonas_calceolata.AAC.3